MLEYIQNELRKVQDEDVRQVSHELYPSIVKMGMAPAVRSLVNRFSDAIDIDLDIDARVSELDLAGEAAFPEKLRVGIYRIAEEAITNVMKHADATSLQVRLACEGPPDRLVLSVEDNGRGFDSTTLAEGQGLVALSDYAEAIGGKAEITSVAGQGTTITVAIALLA